MYAHNLKIVELYSRNGKLYGKEKDEFFELIPLPHRPFPFAGFFLLLSRHFQFLTFLPNFLSSSFFVFFFNSLVPGAFLFFFSLGKRESTFTLNFYDVSFLTLRLHLKFNFFLSFCFLSPSRCLQFLVELH